MKSKIFALIFSAINFLALPSCEVKHPPIYTVGDIYPLSGGDGIKLDSAKYIENEDDTCNIILTYTLYINGSYYLNYDETYIRDGGKKFMTDKT